MFELCNVEEKRNMPRWWWNQDMGPTDRWATGRVETIEADKITVAYTIHHYMGTGYVQFPHLMHEKYTDKQWLYDGYLQTGECDCGSASLGYGSHSHWCTADAFNRRKDGV